MPHHAHAPGRPTLGLVTANIHLGVGAILWSGVLAAAERGDANVICFPGGEIRPDGAPRAALYDLVGPARLDGVISWTSTLGISGPGEAGARRFARRLRELPVVSLNSTLDGHETLRCDSHAGMREAVRHLVQTHGRRRLACVRGPLANPVFLDRYRAFKDALARHRVPLRRSLVAASTGFSGGAGAFAMRVLLDIRGLRPGVDFDALVACSDVLAADAVRFLAARGIRVPEDLAVVGFNDSLEARLSDPPLTSVSLPFAELGELAVDTLLARLRGIRPPARTAVAGTLVTRRSCGCHSALVAQGGAYRTRTPLTRPLPGPGAWQTVPGGTRRDDPDSARAGTCDGRAMGTVERGGALPGPDLAALTSSGHQLAAAFTADLAPHTNVWRAPPASGTRADARAVSGGGFLPLLERVLGAEARSFEDTTVWDATLLRARDTLLPRLPVPVRAQAERLFGQARLMVADKAHRLLEYERWAEQQDARGLRELGTALPTTVTVGALADTLARRLPALGAADCRLVLYEDTADSPADRALARWVPLVPQDGGGPGNEPFPASRLLPEAALPGDERFALVVEPLHTGTEHFGFALFDAGPRSSAVRRAGLFRALGDQISAALKGVRLFDEVRRARDTAQQASRLKTRLLDNATDELRTPVEEILRHAHGPFDERGDGRAEFGARMRQVRGSAGHLLRLIDDLLDLSRSEIDALDLTWRLLDPRAVITEAFAAADGESPSPPPAGRLCLPERLPAVRADPARLGQIVRTLLSAAAALGTGRQRPVLSAEVRPPELVIRISRPDLDVTVKEADQLFMPFGSGRPGMRLGPAVARRLAVLHSGTVTLETARRPYGFTLTLPLPSPVGLPPTTRSPDGCTPGRTLLVTSAGIPAEAAELARVHGLTPRLPHPSDDLAPYLDGTSPPAAVVWDTTDGGPQAWSTAQRLHAHPALRHTPFLVYGPVTGDDLAGALRALRPEGLGDPVLIVDGCAAARGRLGELVTRMLPGRAVRTAADGTAALALVADEVPCLLVAARALDDMDGFDLVERIAARAAQPVPAVLLSDGERSFTAADVRRAEPHPSLVLLGRDILTDEETGDLLVAMVRRAECGTPRSGGGAPVRHALVYVEQHYRHRVSRWQVAQAAGVSEDHLSRLFHRELGLPLWEYLTRLRIQRAKERLRLSDESVGAVARAVGFHDRAYFSRVFRKVTGVAPHAYREP